MSSAGKRQNFVAEFLRHPAVELVSAIVALTAISEVIDWYQEGQVGPGLALVLAAIFIVWALIAKRRVNVRSLPSIDDSQFFFPFISHQESEKRSNEAMLLSRDREAKELLDFIERNHSKYVFLTGTSGVGKSILLADYFDYSSKGKVIGTILEYEGLLDQFHRLTRKMVDQSSLERSNELHQQFRSVSAGASLTEGQIDQLMRVYVESLNFGEPVLLVLEQSERALRLAGAFGSSEAIEFRTTLALLKHLRTHAEVRLLFSIRSDFTIEAIEALIDPEVKPAPVFGKISDFVAVFVLSGIDTSKSSSNGSVLEGRFESVAPPEKRAKIWETLELADGTRSNTFVVQLAGYMLEHFGKTDPRVMHALEDQPRLAARLIDLFLEKLSREYFVATDQPAKSAHDARSALLAILFTLADENQGAGRALTASQISRLSHFPTDLVNEALEFVVSKGVIHQTANGTAYRIAHDLLADNILRSDIIELRSDYKNALRVYASRAETTSKAAESEAQGNIFLDLFNDSRVTLPQFTILLCMLLCLIRLLWPEQSFALMEPVNLVWSQLVPNSVETFEFSFWHYLPILVVHFLWVSFMYKLDRGYFARVCGEGVSLTRIFSAFGAPLGAVLGVLVMFTPSLFIIPIIAGGVFLALAYLSHTVNDGLLEAARANAIDLSWKSGLNMIVAIAVTVATYAFLTDDVFGTSSLADLVTIWVLCLGFWYYWIAMQARQGSQEGWSTLLLLFDRSRQLRD